MVASIGIVLLNLVLGGLKARHGFLLGQAAVGLFAILIWQGQGLAWYASAYFLLGGYRVIRSLAAAQTRHLVEQSQMGLAYGVTETVSGLAMMLAPMLAGLLYEKNPETIYIWGAILIGFSLLINLRFLPIQTDAEI